jgi:uncharacterized cofD-like protein
MSLRHLPRVVVIGGGTGTFVVLSGLKKYPVDLSAIVSMADSGGSTGMLRTELGMLPPGSVRPALIALSESPQLLRKLFTYRFANGTLKDHNFGNLFLAALHGVTGSFDTALREASKILAVRGRVIPVTTTDTHLVATLSDGTEIVGEGVIDTRGKGRPIRRVRLTPPATPNPEALEAIARSQLIVIGPGDLYTSVIPNLLVRGIPEALANSRATVVYVVNVMTKRGETDGFTVGKFVEELEQYLGRDVLDAVIVNTAKPKGILLAAYRRERQSLVAAAPDELARLPYRMLAAPLLSHKELIRHDPARLARLLATFLIRSRPFSRRNRIH